MRNALVALGGGPSPVINASLTGVIERLKSCNAHVDKIYASWHGIEGVLLEQLIDMGTQKEAELKLLKNTPASGAIGTCRYKLRGGFGEDYERIVRVLEAHDVGYFFYIGGNDSMDTADKVLKLARERGMDLTVVGVPKTIDNDLGDEEFTLIDHTPGYGSCARFWAYIIKDVLEENRGMCVSEPVSVLQTMGRDAGYITAAARLADPMRESPLQIYMPEAGFSMEQLHDNVNRELSRGGSCVIVVSEGFCSEETAQVRDGFGHIEFGAAHITAAQIIVNFLNKHGINARGSVTGQVPGVLQRSTFAFRSAVDVEEAYGVGAYAVELAMKGVNGRMATILRASGSPYQSYFDSVPLEKMANSARYFPKAWIDKSGVDVTDDYIRYAAPLIGDGWPTLPLENGIPRFARLDISFIPRKCPDYVPLNMRTR